MGSGKGGSTTVQGVNPYQAAQADFLFNRMSQQTPTGNLLFTPPGQTAPQGQQVSFNQGSLTGPAAALFGGVQNTPMPTAGPGNPTTQPVTQGPTTQSYGGSGGKGGMLQGALGGSGTPTGGMGGTPATATQVLPPALMALENARTTASANTLADTLGRQSDIATGGLPALTTALNTQGLPSGTPGFSGLQQLPTDPSAFTDRTIQAMFQLGAEPLNRQYARQYDQTEQSLANKGLAYPGEAASRQMSDLYREQSQGMQNLALQSVLAGGQESSRALGDLLNIRGQQTGEQQATFGMNEAQRQARGQEQVQNASLGAGARTQQLNELNALLGLPQVNAPPIQSFLNTSPTGVMDAFGLNQNAQIANAQNSMAGKGSTMSGLAQLGSAAIYGLSDRRLKSNIVRIGEVGGINIYSYEIFGKNSIGVMADEVPWAAFDGPDGYKMVDYARVFR